MCDGGLHSIDATPTGMRRGARPVYLPERCGHHDGGDAGRPPATHPPGQLALYRLGRPAILGGSVTTLRLRPKTNAAGVFAIAAALIITGCSSKKTTPASASSSPAAASSTAAASTPAAASASTTAAASSPAAPSSAAAADPASLVPAAI